MRIGVIALGTRGDVQPYLALSKKLQAVGHTIQFMAGSNFESLVRTQGPGLDFVPSVDMEAVMKSEAGKQWASGSSNNQRKQFVMMKKLLLDYGDEMVKPIYTTLKNSDLFITSFSGLPFACAVSEKYNIPLISAQLQPFTPTRSGQATLLPLVSQGNSWFNLLSGKLGQRIIWSISKEATSKLRTVTLGLPPHTAADFARTVNNLPTLLGFSQHIVPHASDLPAQVYTTGYWFLDEETAGRIYQPPADLADFLAAGTAPIYMSFGSMSDSNPDQTLTLMQQATAKTNHRFIIAGGWGATSAQSFNASNIFWLKEAPHSWLFPRCAAVVHHGGAGTTAAALRAGIPALIVPHMGDQPFWGRRVYELGAGVKPIPRHKLTADNLAQAINQLTTAASIKETAAKLGEKIRAEAGLDNAVTALNQIMASLPKKPAKVL